MYDQRLKNCGVTGHRHIPPDKIEYVTTEMLKKILAACEAGYNYYISGFAECADLIFSKTVCDIKRDRDEIKLAAALPYPRTRSKEVQDLLNQCDDIKICSDKYYRGCFHLRNRYIIDHSSLIIAVYDGRKTGGTYTTLQYARKQNKEIQIIEI